jgi:hypothetical protein
MLITILYKCKNLLLKRRQGLRRFITYTLIVTLASASWPPTLLSIYKLNIASPSNFSLNFTLFTIIDCVELIITPLCFKIYSRFTSNREYLIFTQILYSSPSLIN